MLIYLSVDLSDAIKIAHRLSTVQIYGHVIE